MTDASKNHGLLLSEDDWPVDDVPPEFSARVASLCLEQRSAGGGVRSRGLFVPVLLVALLVSFGAVASLASYAEGRVRLLPAEDTGTLAPREHRVSVPLSTGSAFAERAVPAEPEVPTPRSAKPAREPNPEVLPDMPKPPRQVHQPRCECGTSGVVCSCAD